MTQGHESDNRMTNWTSDRLDLQGWAIAQREVRRARTALAHAEAELHRCERGARRYVREHGPTTVEFTTGEVATVHWSFYGVALARVKNELAYVEGTRSLRRAGLVT